MSEFRYYYHPAVTLTDEYVVYSTVDSVIDFIAVMNSHTADVTVDILDGNGKKFNAAVPYGPNQLSLIPIPDKGLLFANGYKWKASVSGVVDIWHRGVSLK